MSMKTKDRCKNQPLLTRSVSKEGDRATTASPKVRLMPLHLGVLIKKPPYIVFFFLTPPSLCAMFAGLRSEAGRSP